ncbi:PREDICTED: bidirectional sugar transporter SWEET12-like, partial [Erythranthe guttata]|uniref:bidirectional sugar transporter SWEET12-like n=1 Tax=Erythranthe guttata TaxID=4155 RepID=UPI00064DB6E1
YTFSKICDVKSTVGYTVIPYTVALFASAIWLYYGAIRSYAITLVIINSTGCIIEMAYVVIFFYYWAIFTITVSGILFGIFCTIAFVTYFTRKVRAVRTRSVQGIPLTANAVIWDIYGFAKGDPNIKVRAVRTHSVYGIPITLTCVLTGNAVIWGIYGFAKGDANTWVRAVRTHSVYGIPITLTCVLTGNAVIWGIYGFAKGDANTW